MSRYKYFVVLIPLALHFQIFAQEIAITFDDAPRSDGELYTGLKRSEILLDKLKQYNIPQVAFFANSGNRQRRIFRATHFARVQFPFPLPQLARKVTNHILGGPSKRPNLF